jgi:beta-lactamase regulating signal transducer with metallopeptidase domain
MEPVVLGLLVRALVLLTVAWVAVVVLRRRSASLRALVWTAALGGVLVMPVIASLAPTLDVPMWRATPQPQAGTPIPAVDDTPAVPESSSAAKSPVAMSIQTFTDAAVVVDELPSKVSWTMAAMSLWALVAFALVVRISLSHLNLSRLARLPDAASDERDAAWALLVNQARAALGIRRPVTVRTTDAVGVPATAGLFKPVLLLPAEADDWHEDVKRAVVLHELAHVSRWDTAGQLISQLACAAWWFVPLAWHGARRAAILREQASDDVVLMSGVRASAYAANLLNIARLTGHASLEPAMLAMAHPRRIRERIVAILDPASVRTSLRRPSLAGVTITAALVVALVATVQPTTFASGEPTAPTAPTAPELPAPSLNALVEKPGTAGRVRTSIQTDASLAAVPSTAAPVAQASSLRPCERDLDKNSSSINDDGRNKSWRVTMSGPNCKVDMRVEGEVEFNDTFTDVKSLSRGGTFKLDVTEGGVRRELELDERNGSLTRMYRVDGRERPFDAEGQRWFGEFLITLDRRTAVGVDVRLPQLMRQGGVSAVLKETALMGSDYARTRYYEKLMAARQLNDSERAQLLQQAASMTKSDHYASAVLSEIGRRGFENAEVRTAALSMIDRMDSDHYRSVAVANVVGAGPPTAGDMDVLVRTVERIKSDHYKLEVLRRLINGPLQAQHRAALSRAARTVDSDHYAAEFLRELTRKGVDSTDRQVFFDVIGTIESDHYALEVLRALVAEQAPSRNEFQQGVRVLSGIESDHYRSEAVAALLVSRDLNESDLLSLVTAISPMRGDHYKSESLQKVARHRAATDRVRSAILDASDRMSSHYREQVRRAAGR